uniref:Reverse transcriptase/retrotransposon-derived protein RNase H-like domain-containing protein n=1 Tax=Solanum lycopersicum TaxID=4081 RepID=A0A3Q7J7Y7_SOLLC
MEKCEYAQQEIKFLGHLVTPRHMKDLSSFLGLANYYRKFIAGYSKRAAALTDLLKKDTKWNLKNAIASEPIVKLPDFELPFEVHTDASEKAISGVLVQEVIQWPLKVGN